MVTTLQSHNAKAASTFNKGGPSIGMRGKGRMPFLILEGGESLEVEALLLRLDGGGSLNHRGPTPNRHYHIPSRSKGIQKPTQKASVGSVVRWAT